MIPGMRLKSGPSGDLSDGLGGAPPRPLVETDPHRALAIEHSAPNGLKQVQDTWRDAVLLTADPRMPRRFPFHWVLPSGLP